LAHSTLTCAQSAYPECWAFIQISTPHDYDQDVTLVVSRDRDVETETANLSHGVT